MRITELFTAQSIALDVAAPDQAAILDKLVDLQATHGNITDKDAYKKALYAREAEASTYVDNGITVPHARTACVTRPSLAALRLSTPVQYNADDDGKTDLLFAIAAPENGSLHIDMLARMMQMLMNDDFVEKLRAAKTPAEFLDAIDAQEDAQFGEESFTQQEIPQNGYRVLAVTACPNGIAHTYMAAEALTKMGDKLGLPTKVETNGSDGAKNVLTPEEIAACDGIIIAADKNVETARFDGKPVLFARVDDGIHKPEELIKKIVHGEVPVYHAEGGAQAAEDASGKDSFGRALYKNLMNGVSHMIPFITGGGILIALSYFLDRGNAGAEMFGRGTSLAMLVRTIGNTSFNLMYVVLAGFIAMSVGDLPALVACMAGGMLAIQGTSLAPQAEWVSSGFWGAMIAGFAAGLVVKLLRAAFKRLPSALVHIKTVLLYPVVSLAVVGFMMVFLVNAPLGRFNTWIYQLLASMQGGSRVVLAAVLGALMAVDFGGPINKAAYLFGTVALAGGQEEFMAAVMAGGMVPPLGVALAGTLFPERFTTKERHTAMTDYLMGACFITEGVVPFVLRDPLHVIPSCMMGASLAAALSMLFGCAVPAPHGGMFLLPLNPHPFRYLLALLMGSLLTAVTLAALRRKYPPKDEEQPTN